MWGFQLNKDDFRGKQESEYRMCMIECMVYGVENGSSLFKHTANE